MKSIEYRNRVRAWESLRRQGYDLSRSSFYNHCAQGLCRVEEDGSIMEDSLARYVRVCGAKFTGKDDVDQGKALKIRKVKLECEVKKLQEQISLLRLERQTKEGIYVNRNELSQEFAGKIAIIMTSLQNLTFLKSEDWVDVVRKNPDDATNALREVLWTDIENEFDRLSRLESFSVIFQKSEGDLVQIRVEENQTLGED